MSEHKNQGDSKAHSDSKVHNDGMLSINSEHKIRSENLPFDIDVWYPSIAQFTFPTVFVPLTRLEAQAILNFQHTRFNARPRLTAGDIEQLQQLESRLNATIKQRFPEGAFLRLCGRSPKDGDPVNREAVLQQFERELKALRDAGAEDSINTKLRAIARVTWLKVASGAEAMSLLLTSERVFTDCHDWLQWGEPEQVVLRQYEPQLALENEFRAFVSRGRITCISQVGHGTAV